MTNQGSQNSAGNSTPPVINPDSVTCPHCGKVNPSWRSTCENCDQAMDAETKLGKGGKVPRPQNSVDGKCQNCNSRPGKPYSFHYLKHIGTGNTALYSDYHDAGTETAFLCDMCVKHHRTKESLQFVFLGIFFLSASFLSLGLFVRIIAQTNNFSAIFLASGLTTLILGVGSIWILIKNAKGGTNSAGVSLAMQLWKKWLTEQGYTTILYEEEYQKLKAKG